MGSVTKTIKFDISTDNYASFIQQIRDWAKDPKRGSHGRAVLPYPPLDPKKAEYMDMELHAKDKDKQNKELVLKVRIVRHELYIVGYLMDGAKKWLEFTPDKGKSTVIPDSESLNFTGNYNSLGEPKKLGYYTFTDCIVDLAQTKDSNKRKSSLTVLLIMIAESVRFQKLSDLIIKQMRGKTDINFESWMGILIDHWAKLSNRLLCEDQFGITFRLPDDRPVRKPHILTRTKELHIVTSTDAANCIAVLLGKPADRSKLDEGDYPIRWEGSRLLQVYSVRINKADGEIYGKTEVKDDLGTYLLYNRQRTDYEVIRNSQTLTLNGPNRSLSARSFSVNLDLKKRGSNPSADTEVSKNSPRNDISFEVGDVYRIFEDREARTVTGKNGSSATVYFTAFRDAIQATIEVVLISENSRKDPVELYGSLVARYNIYEYNDEETKLYYTTALFKKSSKENGVKVKRGSQIPLLRPVIAVPTSGNLILEASFMSASSGNYIASGSPDFAPQVDGKSSQDIKGNSGHVRVTVTWKVVPDSN